jgi:hypothetical protein
VNSTVLAKIGGFITQSLLTLRGNRTGVVAALFAMLLFVAGCGGGGSTTVTPTPTFTPPAGFYSSAQNVTVADTNQNAVLHCTNDGSKPTSSSPQCANPVTVSQSQTLSAIAIAPGMNPSAVATAQYTIASSTAVPTVTGIGPATGPTSGETAVTIIGTNFTGVTSVNFGTVPATSFVVNSASSITATSPAEGAGAVNITVITSGGTSATSNADLYTYTASPMPVITSITPSSGLVGSSVAILGTNFGSTQGSSTVSFNGTLATTFATWTSTGIVVMVPTGATTGSVVVTVGGVASAGVAFTVTLPAPTISGISPSSGAVGAPVTIEGANFGTMAGTVTFNGIPATIASGGWTSQYINVTVPSGLSSGSVTVTVNTATSPSQSASTTFTVASSAPAISGISPSSGAAGASVTISGVGFGSSKGTVTFGGTPAAVTSWADGSIAVTVPSGSTAGSVPVQVTTTAGQTASTTFTVIASPVTINSISPSSGAVGTQVTISGSGFGSTAGTVDFGTTAATVTSGNWSDSLITTTVPSGLSTGSVTVTVNTAASPSQSGSTTFTVLPSLSGVVVSGPASGGAGIGASVQLYAAGTSGYGTGAQPIGNAVQTTSTTGAFSGITYDCSTITAPGDQLYLVATGDTSGVVLMAALGSCSSIGSSVPSSVTINEATTIASAYALSGFAMLNTSGGGGITIGAPGTGSSCTATAGWKSSGASTCNYTGLSNAFATVSNLVDLPSGTVLSITPAYKSNPVAGSNISQVPQARINTLANILAACVDAAGNCTSLSGLTGNSADTLQSALYIAQHPGKWNGTTGAASLYNLVANPTDPFTPPYGNAATTLSAEPNDWALAIIYQGAGLSNAATLGAPQPTGMAIDGEGNIWVTAQNTSTLPSGTGTETGGLVAVFSNQGKPLSLSATSASNIGGYTTGGIVEPQAIAIDQNGYAWIGNYPSNGSTAGSITVLDKTGTPQYGTSTPYTNPLMMIPSPYGIAVDANNNVWISSNAGNASAGVCGGENLTGPWGGSIVGLNSSGNAISNNGTVADYFSDNSTCPTYLSIDANGNLWTFDYGDSQLVNPSSQDVDALSLLLFSTRDGSVTGGPYNNFFPLSSQNMAIDSSGSGWFSANLEVGGSTTQGIGKMPNIGGVTDQSALNPAGPLGGSLTDVYNPTVFSPASANLEGFVGSLAVDGAGQVWAVGKVSNTPGNALFAINSSDNGLVSPSGGYLGFDGSGLAPIALSIYNGGGTAVDGSGNVWIAGQAVSYPGGNDQGAELTEYVGIGAPAQTPLVSGLINGGTPGTRP